MGLYLTQESCLSSFIVGYFSLEVYLFPILFDPFVDLLLRDITVDLLDILRN